MKCPHCNKEIDDAVMARHLASKGGKARDPKKAYRPSSRKARAMALARWGKRK